MEQADEFLIELTATGDSDDRERVEQGLVAFNRTRSPYHDASDDDERKPQPLDVYVRDGEGQLLGGIVCDTFWGWLCIDLVWLDERARGRRYGSRMMAMAEVEARRRGCTRARVTTYSFQARGFYEKLGYRVVGQLDDWPPGGAHYTLRKDFA